MVAKVSIAEPVLSLKIKSLAYENIWLKLFLKMTKVLEDKIVSLETQLKDVTTTLFKYERRLKDQKLFCDCVAKFFLHKFGMLNNSNLI